jgi:peptidoglycan/xylan/chitin deacetylase (PgdA/CDA1 family)
VVFLVGAVAAVFMYHHVSPSVQPGRYARALTVTPQEFNGQLAWLRARGCSLVGVSALMRDARTGTLAPCEVALTFDDGYDDAALYAAPLLKSAGATGTFFISTGWVGTPGHVTVAQLRVIGDLGMELASHTVHHVDLNRSSARVRDGEIERSGAMLESWTGNRADAFAYPSGQFSGPVERSVAAAGYSLAFTTVPGRIDERTIRDMYALPRYRVVRGSGLALMRAVLGSGASQARDDSAAVRAMTSVAVLPSDAELAAIARERIEGNDAPVAERIGVSLLRQQFPEPIQKIRVLTVPPACVAGIMLSGSHLHEPVTAAQFEADARAMAALALEAAPTVAEVDVWAIVPQPIESGAVVAGDLALPTDRTVLSITVRRGAPHSAAFVDADWALHLR